MKWIFLSIHIQRAMEEAGGKDEGKERWELVRERPGVKMRVRRDGN